VDLFVLVAARDGVAEELETSLRSEAERSLLLAADVSATLLRRLTDDPFRAQYPLMRPYDWVLHVQGLPDEETAVEGVHSMANRIDPLVHADLSGVLVGSTRTVTGDGGGPQRFIYLMRRKAGTSTGQFQAHWGGPHAEFGRATTGILGYDQFHPVPDASRRAAGSAGFAVWQVDGVPNLHLTTWQEFVAAAVGSETGNAAIEDERSFVDASNSVGFTCEVVATW
jgi:hypothetical protein